MTVIVGFVAGPSAGKSTLALELAGWMKRERLNVEYVSEYPKDLAWEESTLFDDQIHIFGEQWKRHYRLIDKVDWIVTDGPMIASLFYADHNLNRIPSPFRTSMIHMLKKMAKAAHFSFEHKLFFIDRGDRKFIQQGRIHDEEQSRQLDQEILETAHDHGVKIEARVSNLQQVLDNLGFIWKNNEV